MQMSYMHVYCKFLQCGILDQRVLPQGQRQILQVSGGHWGGFKYIVELFRQIKWKM